MDQQMSYFLPPITNTLPTGNCTLREVYRWITEDKSLETVTNELRAFIREDRIAEYRQLKQRQLPFVTPHSTSAASLTPPCHGWYPAIHGPRCYGTSSVSPIMPSSGISFCSRLSPP